jgi:superfamily II DNA or RNA helicase
MTGTGTLALRDYQVEAVEKLEKGWADGRQRLAVVLPTGTGKTVTFAGLAARFMERTGENVAVIAHRDELISQAASKFHQVAPGYSVGVVQGASNAVGAQVAVCSIQTLARGRAGTIGRRGLVIVDEAHHSGAATYLDALEKLGCFTDPAHGGTLLAGFSATLVRAGGGLDQIFQEVVYKRDILDFVRADGKGALLDARGVRVVVQDLDLSKVKRSGGDYSEGSLGEAIVESLAPEEIAKAYVEHGKREDGTFKAGLCFSPTVESAYVIADAMCAVGIRAAAIDGTTRIEDRREVLARYFRGELDVLCNCMVLTEGFDAPQAEIAVIARPTTSAALYVQMVGRVLRPHPGQTCATVIDVVGVGARHRLATLADITTEKVVPVDGESLVEAMDREAAEDDLAGLEAEARRVANGKLVSEGFDLFGRSSVVWHQSPRKGVWFVAVGERVVFLAPSVDDPSRFVVSRAPLYRATGEWLTEPLDLSMAFSWAEQVVRDDPKYSFAAKGSSWRSGKPTQPQRDFADGQRVVYPADVSKSDLSDMISWTIASRKLDGLNMFKNYPDIDTTEPGLLAATHATRAKAPKVGADA